MLLPVTTLAQATIISDPDPENLMWLYGFRACEVADLTGHRRPRCSGGSGRKSAVRAAD
ncbi:hypothetical protein [Nonomuraea dietziae]|uniref:Uncharacterized protein n=1 Tax=Nonomuraea dietziae TaxID=65515 RepID=A0A7W5V8U5_9ACTN|nr:hypothetical protein [Nonomuraea dietziae]MBB3729365.1 hypothetical protein [Nonomuraea dietziae]